MVRHGPGHCNPCLETDPVKCPAALRGYTNVGALLGHRGQAKKNKAKEKVSLFRVRARANLVRVPHFP